MGRGIHFKHKEKKKQVNVKFTYTIFGKLIENDIINQEINANYYVNKLVEKDLKERGILI